jgi:hypothetical protein
MTKTQTRGGGRFADRPGQQGTPTEQGLERLALAQLPILSAGAGAIHLAVAADHFEYFWLHGTFFVVIGMAQLAWAGLIMAFPVRTLFQAAVVGNGAVIATWIVTRVVGAPFGANPWTPEPIALEGALATSFEAALVLWSLRLAFGFGPRLPEARSPAQFVPVAALLLLFAAGGIVSASIGGQEHGGNDEMAAAAGGEHSSGSPIAPDDTLLLEIKDAIRAGGAKAGLDRLEAAAAESTEVRTLAHQYVHALGRSVYDELPNPPAAFASCDSRFESGCYHGVLQRYFEDNPNFTGGDVARLCSTTLTPGSNQNLRFQCLHGLGHGLTLFYNHNLLRPLRYCDFLSTEWERRSCYGGVFMENIVWAQRPANQQQLLDGESVIPEDLHYPCNAVAEKYRSDCYFMQSSTILWLNGFDFGAGFAECDRAPGKYVDLCYRSMGRDIAGYTLHRPAPSHDLCTQGARNYIGSCLAGVAQTLINLDGTTDGAFRFCGMAARDVEKYFCYQAIGYSVNSVAGGADQQRAECARAKDPRWVAVCRQAAQAA